MGKKKGKPATFRPEPDEEAEGEDVASADATTAPTPPPPPPPPTADDAGAASDKPTVDAATSAMAPDAAAGTSAEDGEAPAIRAGMVVTGTLETRHVPSVPYCEGAQRLPAHDVRSVLAPAADRHAALVRSVLDAL